MGCAVVQWGVLGCLVMMRKGDGGRLLPVAEVYQPLVGALQSWLYVIRAGGTCKRSLPEVVAVRLTPLRGSAAPHGPGSPFLSFPADSGCV